MKRALGKKPLPVQQCPSQILHGLAWNRTCVSALRKQRLAIWTTARSVTVWNVIHSEEYLGNYFKTYTGLCVKIYLFFFRFELELKDSTNFRETPNTKLHENTFSGYRVVTCRQTTLAKIAGLFLQLPLQKRKIKSFMAKWQDTFRHLLSSEMLRRVE